MSQVRVSGLLPLAMGTEPSNEMRRRYLVLLPLVTEPENPPELKSVCVGDICMNDGENTGDVALICALPSAKRD